MNPTERQELCLLQDWFTLSGVSNRLVNLGNGSTDELRDAIILALGVGSKLIHPSPYTSLNLHRCTLYDEMGKPQPKNLLRKTSSPTTTAWTFERGPFDGLCRHFPVMRLPTDELVVCGSSDEPEVVRELGDPSEIDRWEHLAEGGFRKVGEPKSGGDSVYSKGDVGP